MTALTKARDTERLDRVAPGPYGAEGKLTIKNNEVIWKGALLMMDQNNEVVKGTLGLTRDLRMLGRAPKTIDNAADGELTEVDRGTFHWIMSSADAGDVQENAYVLDDQTVTKTQHGSGTQQVDTVTPTAVNDQNYALTLLVDEHGEGIWTSHTLFALGDGSATATEICDDWRTQLAAITALDGLVVGTGTTTFIMTGAQGVRFETLDSGPGVSAVANTTAGVYQDRPLAGTIVGFNAVGVFVQPPV